MKKYKLFLLVTALIFAILGTAVAFAAPSATAKLDGPSAVRPGNAITLEFKLTSGEIYGLEADLSEAGPISRQSIVLNPELSGWEYNLSGDKLILYSNDFTTAFSGENKTMFTIRYALTDSAAVGDEISVKVKNCLVANPMTGEQSDPFSASYEKTIQRQLSTNANLSSLSVDGKAVDGFGADKTEYQLTVPYTTASIQVSAACADDNASYAVEGSTLKYGVNNVTVTVTAESGATKAYVIKVTREAPPNLASLNSLSAGSYSLEPAFDPSVFDYTVTVPYTKKSISFSHTEKDGVKVSVIGGEELEVGENLVKIKVVDQYENENVYTVVVTRRQNNNTNLIKLTVEGHTFSPAFDYNVTNYTMSVNSSVTSLTVKAVAAGDGATAEITGTTLDANGGVVVVTVTAMDGSTKDYKITVTKTGGTPNPPVDPNPPAADASKLTSLSVKNYTISPAFSQNTLTYTLSVPNDVTSIKVDAKGENGSEVTISGADNLKVGENKIKITVKTNGKEDTVYTLNVVRAEAAPVPGEAKLQSITLSDGTLSPVFNPDIFSYIVYLPYETSRITVSAIGSDTAAITGTGEYTLLPGSNLVTLRVSTADGEATYTITAYVMPVYDGSIPNIGAPSSGTVSAGGMSIVGNTQLGGKLVASMDGVDGYMVRWFRDGNAVGGSPEYVVTSADLGKTLTVVVYDEAGNTLATKTIAIQAGSVSLNTASGGFDTVGMVISLIAAMATLIIGYILGKMRRRSHSHTMHR